MVGSVAGQRFWSTLLPPDVNSITSGVWTPDDQYVYLGTSQGGLLVMDIQGNTVGRVCLREGVPITGLSWNCERFNMEEQTTDRTNVENNQSQQQPFPYPNQTQFRKSELSAMTNRKSTNQEHGSNNVTAVPSYKSDGKNTTLKHYSSIS